MEPKSKKTDLVVHLLFLLSIIGLVIGFLYLANKINQLGNGNTNSNSVEKLVLDEKEVTTTKCNEECESVIEKKVAEALVQITEELSENPTPTPTAKQNDNITYINLNGTFTTSNTDWTDIKSTDFVIDLDKEYGLDAYLDWEVIGKTSSINSKVYFRLHDVTHNIAVNGSELSTNSTTSSRLSSGRLYLWKGLNTYRVQMKSTAPYESTFDSGRVKIVY